jgi:porphobilinogen synthase
MRENVITSADLIYPVFVLEGRTSAARGLDAGRGTPVGRPLLPVAEECVKLGMPVLALFPVIDPA